MDNILADRDRLHAASLTTYAFHKPSELASEQERINRRARAVERGEAEPRVLSNTELRAFARRVSSDITAGGVFSDLPEEVS